MKKIMKCECGVDTWYLQNDSVGYVDAMRTLAEKCKCGGEE